MGGGTSKYHENGNGQIAEDEELKTGEQAATEWPTKLEIEKVFNSGASNSRNFDCWEFDIWQFYSVKDHLLLLSGVFYKYEFNVKFNMKFDKWNSLIQKIRKYMASYINPYHNFTHLVDVTQTAHAIVGEFEARTFLEDIDIFSLILSCLVHDLEHPGTNNLYQINAETLLAIRYNDISVLENHHCALAFAVFGQPDSNIFSDVAAVEKRRIRKTIIELILSTDMSFHFALNNELNECMNRNSNESKVVSGATFSDKDRVILLRSILHAADISNPLKPWSISKKWSDLVVEEFFAQGDREKREGLSVSMNMDRNTTSQDEISLNFADFIVAPFFLSLMRALPKLSKACRILESNRDMWDNVLRKRVQHSQTHGADEILEKWATKRKDFATKMRASLEEADRKLVLSSS
jgi:hypothetical protein